MPTPRRYLRTSAWPPPLYPRSGPEGTPEPTGWRKWLPLIGVPALIVVLAALVLGGLAAFALALAGV